MKSIFFLFFFLIFFNGILPAQNMTFKVVPLGIMGGIDESNLSAYMVAPQGSEDYVSLDAGTLYAGIKKAIEHGTFSGTESMILRGKIKGYLISHGHLDHLAGLIINSPDDTVKNIYAMPYVIDILKDKYFTWEGWANFADEGENPTLNKYHYVRLDTSLETRLAGTDMCVRSFELSHVNPYKSTAFLLRHQTDYLLYLGDTGPDAIEKSDKMRSLWKAVAPLVRTRQLKAVFIEVSYPNEQPDNLLFGHLTPKWLMEEMQVLADYAGKEYMPDLPVVITHMKPTMRNEDKIRSELLSHNPLHLRIIFPKQGEMMHF